MLGEFNGNEFIDFDTKMSIKNELHTKLSHKCLEELIPQLRKTLNSQLDILENSFLHNQWEKAEEEQFINELCNYLNHDAEMRIKTDYVNKGIKIKSLFNINGIQFVFKESDKLERSIIFQKDDNIVYLRILSDWWSYNIEIIIKCDNKFYGESFSLTLGNKKLLTYSEIMEQFSKDDFFLKSMKLLKEQSEYKTGQYINKEYIDLIFDKYIRKAQNEILTESLLVNITAIEKILEKREEISAEKLWSAIDNILIDQNIILADIQPEEDDMWGDFA